MTDETTIAAEAARDEAKLRERRRGRGCYLYAALVVLIALAALAAVGMTHLYLDRRAGEEALARAKAAGDPLTVEEMYASYGKTPESDAATARWLAAIAATEAFDAGGATKTVPLLGYVPEAKSTLDERGFYDAATLARTEPFLKTVAAEALQKAHAARVAGGTVRYPIAFEDGFVADLENIGGLRRLASALVLEAEVAAAKGDTTGATESLLTLVAFSETLAEAPTKVAFSTRSAVFGIATDHAMHLIDRAEFSPEDLRRLQTAFERQDFHRDLLRAMRGDQFQDLQFHQLDEPIGEPKIDRTRFLPFRGEDQALTLDLYREFFDEAEAGLPQADVVAARVDDRIGELHEAEGVETYRYARTVFALGSFRGTVGAAIRSEGQARMSAACCACERYRQDRGEWPPTLETLVPEYLAAVPLDPEDDQPLRYSVVGEKMTIHSLAHFRPENQPNQRTFENGYASHVLGEPYDAAAKADPPIPPPDY